jgi:hypothetical protein
MKHSRQNDLRLDAADEEQEAKRGVSHAMSAESVDDDFVPDGFGWNGCLRNQAQVQFVLVARELTREQGEYSFGSASTIMRYEQEHSRTLIHGLTLKA